LVKELLFQAFCAALKPKIMFLDLEVDQLAFLLEILLQNNKKVTLCFCSKASRHLQTTSDSFSFHHFQQKIVDNVC